MRRLCGLTESVLLSQKYESELPGGQILKGDEVSYIVFLVQEVKAYQLVVEV